MLLLLLLFPENSQNTVTKPSCRNQDDAKKGLRGTQFGATANCFTRRHKWLTSSIVVVVVHNSAIVVVVVDGCCNEGHMSAEQRNSHEYEDGGLKLPRAHKHTCQPQQQMDIIYMLRCAETPEMSAGMSRGIGAVGLTCMPTYPLLSHRRPW